MAQLQYFLGANSPAGFYSLYHELLPAPEAQTIYILKGGAGCGKSSLLRRVARHAEAAGLDTVLIPCSGDPDSLDALILPQRGAALVDGTAPHAIVPAGHLLPDKPFKMRNRAAESFALRRSFHPFSV